MHHIAKPDLDNLAKAVMDAISDLGTIWRDDSQVAALRMSKMYTGCGGGCTVVIKPLV
jgi:Holliday junction resolvase RusA-like endonuclease